MTDDAIRPANEAPDSFEGRIAQYCAWFGLEPPALKYDEDEPTEVLLTDDLIRWVRTHGACIGWLVSGDAKRMAAAHRTIYRDRSEAAA